MKRFTDKDITLFKRFINICNSIWLCVIGVYGFIFTIIALFIIDYIKTLI